MKPPYPGLVSARCETCRYFWHITSGSNHKGCEYILQTGVCRPCPPGDRCTVYEKDTGERKPAEKINPFAPFRWTVSRIKFAMRLRAEGLTYRDVAMKMGTTASSVRTAVYRYRKESPDGTTDLL